MQSAIALLINIFEELKLNIVTKTAASALVVLGLLSCGGGSETPSAGEEPMDLDDDLSPEIVDTSSISSAISQSQTTDCGFSKTSDCMWVSGDEGITVELMPQNIHDGTHSFFVSSTRDTRINLVRTIVKPLKSDLIIDAYNFDGATNFDLEAGNFKYVNAELLTALNVPHRTDFEFVALEFSEQDADNSYAVFSNVANLHNAMICSAGMPCTWRNEANDLEITLQSIIPEPQQTISLDVGDGALSVTLDIQNNSTETMTLTATGPNHFVGYIGNVDYQLLRIQRLIGFGTPAAVSEQVFRGNDLQFALDIPPVESPGVVRYTLLLTIPSGRQTNTTRLESLSFLVNSLTENNTVSFQDIDYGV